MPNFAAMTTPDDLLGSRNWFSWLPSSIAIPAGPACPSLYLKAISTNRACVTQLAVITVKHRYLSSSSASSARML